MPVLNVLVISPVAKLADVLSVFGINCTTNLYTEADTPPRSVTHKARNGSVTPTQESAIDAHIASPHPDLAGVIAVKWQRGPGGDPNPWDATLESNGLTSSST